MSFYLFNSLCFSEMRCAMTLALQSPDRVGMSPMWWQLHLSIPSQTVLSDEHTHRKTLLANYSFQFGHQVYAGQVTSHLKVLFASLATSEETNRKARIKAPTSKAPGEQKRCGWSAKGSLLQWGNISRHSGAGPSIFIGLPVLHTAYGQRDSHTNLFLPSSSLFLSKTNLKKLTENFKLPEKWESGEAAAETTGYMDWSVLALMPLAFFPNYFSAR